MTADGDTQLLCIKKKMKIFRRLIEAIGFNELLDFSTPPRVRRNNNVAAPTLTPTIVFAGFSVFETATSVAGAAAVVVAV